MRVCLLSAGGDAPGINAVIRGFVHASYRLGVEVIGCESGFEGLLDPRSLRRLTIDSVRGALPKGGSILGCSTRINPFFVNTSSGAQDRGPAIVDRLRSSSVDALVLIGGDGTMVAADRFSKLGLPCLGIPKTIDNDLAETDQTIGFATAIENAMHALDALHSTTEAHARVMIVELMGRDCGAIALHAGIAGGADIILLPEIPYYLDRVIAKIRERETLGRRFSLIAISEGARPADGDVCSRAGPTPGHLRKLGGAGHRLQAELEAAALDHEVRVTVLGHLLRGGSPSAGDRVFGTQLGTYAAQLCKTRSFGRRIVLQKGTLTSVPLASEAKLHAFVSLADPLLDAAALVGVELGDDLQAVRKGKDR